MTRCNRNHKMANIIQKVINSKIVKCFLVKYEEWKMEFLKVSKTAHLLFPKERKKVTVTFFEKWTSEVDHFFQVFAEKCRGF